MSGGSDLSWDWSGQWDAKNNNNTNSIVKKSDYYGDPRYDNVTRSKSIGVYYLIKY